MAMRSTQHIKKASDELLQIEEGSLYPALQRMLREGWLKATWGQSATNRRIRIYTLTPAGARHLQRETSSFERMLEGIRRVLAPVETLRRTMNWVQRIFARRRMYRGPVGGNPAASRRKSRGPHGGRHVP